MGTQFFWIYDAAVLAILIAMTFVGFKNGFVKTLFGFISVIIAFFIALWVSDFASEKIYIAFFEEKIESTVDSTISDAVGDVFLSDLADLEFDKIIVGGKTLDEISLNGAGTGKVSLDLNEVNMSKTGIEDVDLSLFGLSSDTVDYSKMKIGTVELKKSDIDEYGLGKIIVAQALSSGVQNTSLFTTIKRYSVALGNAVPLISGDAISNIQSGDNSTLSELFLTMINTKKSLGDCITNNFIKPFVIITIRTIVFILVFAIASIILLLVTKSLSVINKIPLIGGANAALGGVLGIVQGLLTISVVCIVIRLIIYLTDNSLIFLNSETINSTYLFGFLYDFKYFIFI